MLVHENTLVSLDLLEEEFICNLEKCKGICCVEGDSGAPLEPEEVEEIRGNLPAILRYLSLQSNELINAVGFFERDTDGDLVTKCHSGRDCVFATNEGGIYKCGIETAWENGESTIKKPVSCHLYPIRVSKVGEYDAVNYNKWDICSDACKLGKKNKMPVYKFLSDALKRKFGETWYIGLEELAEEYLEK